MKKRRTVIIIQARMGSTRLPGKSLKPLLGKPMLFYVVDRLRPVKEADALVVATSSLPQDDPIAEFCNKNGIALFRGSEEDVLDRYDQAAKQYQADIIVRITGDCPLIDPEVVSAILRGFDEHVDCDYLSNTQKRTFPRGLDVEVFTSKALEEAAREAKSPHEREHVTPFIYHHPERYHIRNYRHEPDLSHHRWTVDTPEDFELVTKIFEELLPTKPHFAMADVLAQFELHPEWHRINAHIKQKNAPKMTENK